MNRSKLPSAEELNARAAEAIRAEQAGREHEAVQLWNQLRELAPDYPPALDAIGKRAFRTGDLQAAYAAFKRNTDNNPYDLQSWINLALVCQGREDENRRCRGLVSLWRGPHDQSQIPRGYSLAGKV